MQVSLLIPIQIAHKIFEIYLFNLALCLKVVNLVCSVTDNINVKPIVVDYGSLGIYSDKINILCKENDCCYIKEEAKQWSRSKALNIGIDNSVGSYILVIDADTLIPKIYINKNISYMKQNIYTVNFVFNSSVTNNDLKIASAEQMLKLGGSLRKTGRSHICVNRSWLIKNKYNEAYIGWGGEDDDLIYRLALSGLHRKSLNTKPVHLWHPHYGNLMKQIGKGSIFAKYKDQNKERARKFRIKHKNILRKML